MKDWLKLLAAESAKLRRLAVLRAVALSLLLGPGVMVVILSLVSVDIRTIVASPADIILGSVVLLAAFGGVVLAATMFGREFDLGTARVMLLRGIPRGGFLLAKLAVAILTVTILSLLAALVGVAETLLAGWQPTAAHAAQVVWSVVWVVPLVSFAYVGFTALGAILGRSVAAGMLAGLALFLADFLLTTLGSRIPFGEWLPVTNMFALLGETFGLMLAGNVELSVGVAALHLAGFGAVTVVAGWFLFARGDIHR
ncbi:MAG TPA: ABC transporter permease subunit [Anaerolineae bacterium]|nr:ABC transporter permease subunit [Anaerolineae bacterium]